MFLGRIVGAKPQMAVHSPRKAFANVLGLRKIGRICLVWYELYGYAGYPGLEPVLAGSGTRSKNVGTGSTGSGTGFESSGPGLTGAGTGSVKIDRVPGHAQP